MAESKWRGRTAKSFSFESNDSCSCRGKRLEVGVKQVPPSIPLHPHATTGKSPAELLYRRKLSTKLTAVADLEESEELRYQQTRDRDTEKKHLAAEKCVQERDLVLLEKRKENKLSSHYGKEPYQVAARYGDQVQLKSPQGAEYNRYVQHVKRFVIPDREPQE